ncbi:cell division septation protein DedD [Crossiella equi]|uniref:Cell division septation protein DedD n=1 Tax=Crossiella equi TaxID=130796 RepID=A0ABS5ADL1_9PSEU|nr:hypothetical protein [Crossiella equi]MBP2474671.1 cell division septation protein DedD [Crossiella equi]
MGIGRILAAGSALGATGVLIAAPIALAAAAPISVSQADLKPGARVEITTECPLNGNHREPSSEVLEGVKRVSYDGNTHIAKWAAVVKKDAKVGLYVVSYACGADSGTANLSVSAATGTTEPTKPTTTEARPTTSKPVPASSTRPKPTTSTATSTSKVTPKGAPETGGGGTADGGNGLAIAGGAAALAAGAGFGVWALRRRRASAQG